VGISAPQGCGKTTLVGQLTELLNAEGHAAASVSIDDFYLTGAEQDALAASAPDNELLRFRGNAGTHDLRLASDTLGACCALCARVCVRLRVCVRVCVCVRLQVC
jgi:D-glycerate 3-kinase